MSTREPGEERDDGGTSAGDGCDDRCFIEEDAICYELGGPSRCAPGGCGDGCVYGDDGSECPPPAEVRQEECDDFNTRPGDGCDASCRAEDGFDCSAAQPPSFCWEEPHYDGLGPSSPTITDTKPGMRIVSFHEVHLTVAAALRIRIELDAILGGGDPSELFPDQPAEIRPELLLHEPTRDLVVSLTDGEANLQPGEYTLRIRSAAERVGEYTYTLSFRPQT